MIFLKTSVVTPTPVGLSLKRGKYSEFQRRFEEYVATHIQPNQLSPMIDIDATIEFADITPELVAYLKKFNPFGPEIKIRYSVQEMFLISARANW